MTRTLIKNATILPFGLQSDGSLDLNPSMGNILIEDDRITQISVEDLGSAEIEIDGTDQLVTPGFVDAHTHTWLMMEKGAHQNLPLELWMPLIMPFGPLEPRFFYLTSALAAIEAVKNGTTTLQDDIYTSPYTTPEIFSTAAQAYVDVGVRGSLSVFAINKPLHHTMPYVNDLFPTDLKQMFESGEGLSDQAWVDIVRQIHGQWHGRQGLIRVMMAPSASQRVTPALMEQIGALSEELDLAIHTHLLETRTQGITGPEMFGESVVSYAKRHGILTRRTTIAHGIWLTPADMALAAEAGATIVHNITSNCRLCSGIAPVRELTEAGVNLAVGSDGTDTFNLFWVIRMAAMIHSVTHPNYELFPGSEEVLKWATYGGARSTLQEKQIGAVQVGMKADLVFYDLKSLAFTPRQADLARQLTFCEDGRSIRKVFVNGQLVVKDGEILTVNEPDLLAELQEMVHHYQAKRAEWNTIAQRLLPYLDQMYRKAMAQPYEVNRFLRDEKDWPVAVR